MNVYISSPLEAFFFLSYFIYLFISAIVSDGEIFKMVYTSQFQNKTKIKPPKFYFTISQGNPFSPVIKLTQKWHHH